MGRVGVDDEEAAGTKVLSRQHEHNSAAHGTRKSEQKPRKIAPPLTWTGLNPPVLGLSSVISTTRDEAIKPNASGKSSINIDEKPNPRGAALVRRSSVRHSA